MILEEVFTNYSIKKAVEWLILLSLGWQIRTRIIK